MHISQKTKIGPFLVISSVLAVWTFLVAQHVQAHTPDSPTCSGLPTAENFFAGATATIAPGTLAPELTATQGTGSAAKGGNAKYRYAKIIVPQLAAGELRVFDNRTIAGVASDAVLCHGTSTRARYRTSHPSSHTSAESARTSALTAQMKAMTAEDNTAITESSARSALNSAASALRSAASALRSAATALRRADNDDAADTADGIADDLYDTTANDDDYDDARFAAGYDVNDERDTTTRREGVDTNDSITDEQTALGEAADALDTAASNLRIAANLLHDTEAESTLFQLRAEVRPGDQEYILVTTGQDTADEPDLDVQFHGAIAATSLRRNRSFTRGNQDTIPITITAPGLLTLETTGSTDTKGMLDGSDGAEVAYAESGGSSGNFKMFVPVTTASYNVVVEGQTLDTFGEYALGMDFKVAMNNAGNTLGTTDNAIVNVVDAPEWGPNTAVPDDDTTLQIKKIAEDGNTADADYFLFIPTTSGFLTVNANDDATSAKDSNTKGTLYGAMGEGPTGEMRVGEIATDDNTGPGDHFEFTVPVEENKNYLVQVEGTDGQYILEFAHDPVPDSIVPTVTSDAPTARYVLPSTGYTPADLCPSTATTNRSNEICASEGDQHKDRYLLNIAESGTLYVHSTGTTDVDVFLFGPAGDLIDSDADGGTLTNFNMATKVGAGLHLLEVRGKTKAVQGYYEMFVNFVAGAGPEPPTEPTTPTTPTTPATDATGFLGNPPHNSTRSGIGIISGWVCEASNVTITISPVGDGGSPEQTFNIGYGADRPDTVRPVRQCDHTSPDTGFGMAYNFSRLAEGQYRITARADEQQIGRSHLFTVFYLDPDDTFLEGLEREVEVTDFPATGETTTLEWEESSQGFVITDVQ